MAFGGNELYEVEDILALAAAAAHWRKLKHLDLSNNSLGHDQVHQHQHLHLHLRMPCYEAMIAFKNMPVVAITQTMQVGMCSAGCQGFQVYATLSHTEAQIA